MHPLPPPPRAPRRWPYIAGSAVIAVIAAATVSVVLLQSSDETASAADQTAGAPAPAPTTTSPPNTQAPTTTSAPTTVPPTTAAPTTTAAPQPPVIIQQQPPVIIQQQPPVVIQQAPPVYDPNLIPPGTIEDGVHFGYLTDVEGMYQLTFDRVDVEADGTWTNANAKLRTLPTDPSVWGFSYKYAGQAIQVIVQSQRVVGVYAY